MPPAPPAPTKPLPAIPEYGEYAVDVRNLTFGYASSPGQSSLDATNSNTVLNDLSLQLPTGSRCLLIGANGSGECRM